MDTNERILSILWETINCAGADPDNQDSKYAIYVGFEEIKQLIDEIKIDYEE
jgi:hypothetical protein